MISLCFFIFTLALYFFLILILPMIFIFFFFNDTATTEIYPLSLPDALPISLRQPDRRTGADEGSERRGAPGVPGSARPADRGGEQRGRGRTRQGQPLRSRRTARVSGGAGRSEEHTSELQSLAYLVCRLLLEK